MRGPVVDDPEGPLRRSVGLGLHDLAASAVNGLMRVVGSHRPVTLAW